MDQVEYFTHELAPDLRMFHCAEFSCSISTEGCASRWTSAQAPEPNGKDPEAQRAWDALMPCRGCPIGAQHAGAESVEYSAFFGSMICPRCRRGAVRFIQNRVCVSCYNREREMAAGRNARGNRPRQLERRPLHSIRMTLRIDGVPRREVVPAVVDTLEAQVRTMRTVKGRVEFAFAGSPPWPTLSA